MSDPRRLLEGKESPLARELLRSLREDAPPPGSLKRAIALAAAASTTLTATSSLAASSTLMMAAKWALFGALAGGAVAGGGTLIERQLAPPESAARAAVSEVRMRALTPLRSEPRETPAAVEPTLEAPPSPTLSARPMPLSSPSAEPADRASDLREQRLAIETVQKTLAAGRAGEALRLLDDYRARFARPLFQQEASVLRIQALQANGDRAGAEAAAKRFVAENPGSPFARRVQSLVGGARAD